MKQLKSNWQRLTAIAVFTLITAVALGAQPVRLTLDHPGVAAVARVQELNTPALMRIPGVVGTATGLGTNGQVAVKVFVETPGNRPIPRTLDGVDVQVEVTGPFRAFIDPTERFARPVPIGVSVGHPAITAGTLGCRVVDAEGYLYALSNNHVFADENRAKLGSLILQPGPTDGGGQPGDEIGGLDDYVPIDFGRRGRNTIDAAIVSVDPDGVATVGVATPGIPGLDSYGIPNAVTVQPAVGLAVQKYGRTTGWTHGTVNNINARVKVSYDTGDATFIGQMFIGPAGFSAPGDSGSLIVTDDGTQNPVGLLFAGNSSYTIANPIDTVLNTFSVSVDDGTGITTHGSISGTVSESGVGPVAGATVTVATTGHYATTDAKGEYQLLYVPTGTRSFTASAPGYKSTVITGVLVIEGTDTVLTITLDPLPRGSLSGTVIDSESGVGIAGATVSADSGQSTTTENNGDYVLGKVVTGTRTVTASAIGYQSVTLTAKVDAGAETTGVDFALFPAFVVPNGFEDIEAAAYSGTLSEWIRLQEVYDASHFGGAPVTLSGLAFRRDQGGAALNTTVDLEVRLSTTSRSPDALLIDFDSNIGSDATLVFDGTLTIDIPATAGTEGPSPFDIVIPFRDGNGKPIVFDYDPAAGNLLVDVTSGGNTSIGFVDASNAGPGSPPDDSASRIFAYGGTPDVVYYDTGADVIQFDYTLGAPVPITLTTDATRYTAPATIVLTASLSDSVGPIAKVEFFANDDPDPIGEASGSPYTTAWTDVLAGTYSLTAVVTDETGAQATSDPVSVTVDENQPSKITFTLSPITLTSFGKDSSAVVEVTVLDGNAPLEGATVTGEWSYNDVYIGTATGITDSDGVATLTSAPVKTRKVQGFSVEIVDIKPPAQP